MGLVWFACAGDAAPRGLCLAGGLAASMRALNQVSLRNYGSQQQLTAWELKAIPESPELSFLTRRPRADASAIEGLP